MYIKKGIAPTSTTQFLINKNIGYFSDQLSAIPALLGQSPKPLSNKELKPDVAKLTNNPGLTNSSLTHAIRKLEITGEIIFAGKEQRLSKQRKVYRLTTAVEKPIQIAYWKQVAHEKAIAEAKLQAMKVSIARNEAEAKVTPINQGEQASLFGSGMPPIGLGGGFRTDIM